jgi:hypothetical protein
MLVAMMQVGQVPMGMVNIHVSVRMRMRPRESASS